MEQILNKFLVMQKTVNIKGEQHNSQSIPKKVLWIPSGTESNLQMSIFFFFFFPFTLKSLESDLQFEKQD